MKGLIKDAAAAAEKIDKLNRLRTLSGVLVTKESPKEEETPEVILVDLEKLTPKEMLQGYADFLADYATAPFDSDGNKLNMFKGEWTIWSGFPGAGKTTIIKQSIAHLLKNGEKVFSFSGESRPEHFVINLAATAAGVLMPTENHLNWFLDQYHDKLKLWGIIGQARHKQLLATIRDLADEGVTHAFIDSLMCLDIEEGDNEAHRQFANLITATVKAKKIHVHLVAHPRKPKDSSQEPSQNDVAGSANLSRLCDNILFVRRGPDEMGLPGVTPMMIDILKQRERGILGQIQGYYYREFRQFQFTPHMHAPTQYLPPAAYVDAQFDEPIPKELECPF
ncbi:MAG: AAA family ATPase [Proteobacteria bacterium]|nr:AAA family ATPase [Pseudomonadota bacterium]